MTAGITINSLNPSTREVEITKEGNVYIGIAGMPEGGVITILCHIFIITNLSWTIKLATTVDIKAGTSYLCL